jgi:hypothetical protein
VSWCAKCCNPQDKSKPEKQKAGKTYAEHLEYGSVNQCTKSTSEQFPKQSHARRCARQCLHESTNSGENKQRKKKQQRNQAKEKTATQPGKKKQQRNQAKEKTATQPGKNTKKKKKKQSKGTHTSKQGK